MKTHARFLLLFVPLLLTGCDDDTITDPEPAIDVPISYTFERGGETTVSFSGQTERIAMSGELVSLLSDPTTEGTDLLFARWTNDGDPFGAADLNASTKNIRGKVAASRDRFFTNATATAAIRADLAGWMTAQVEEVYDNQDQLAAPGVPGQLPDGSRVRYVNGQGVELDQVFAKSLIGALMVDQIVSNYLSPAVLDEGTNRAANDTGQTDEGKSYTTMEHKWDEAYGYLFGGSPDPADPLATLGEDDDFLNKYLGRVDNQEGRTGIAGRIFAAYKRGRAAIVAGNYEVRDEQADILKAEISRVIAIRSIYYLEQAAGKLDARPAGLGSVFHDLSEAYGFLYSLQFTANPARGDAPLFDRAAGQILIDRMLGDGVDGLWDVTPATLRAIAGDIQTQLDGIATD